MKQTIKQKPQDEQSIDILKRVAKRVEEATVDINDMRYDLKSVKLRLGNVEHNTEIMKVDIEKLKFDMENMKEHLGDKIEGSETRLNKRIEHVADLITIKLGGKLQNHEKRIRKLEIAQQAT